MSKIAIIVGHSRRGTYCEALGKAYMRGAKAGGHEAELFVIADMTFDPILHEGYAKLQPLEPDLQRAWDAIRGADHIVLVFPLWIGTLPAIFKGFIERVLQPDLIESDRAGTFGKPLKGKSARIILTMGMPGLIYRWYYGAHALKMLKRNILKFVGVGSIRSTIHGMIGTASDETRAQWLAEAEAMGRDAA